MAQRIDKVLDAGLPWLVCESAGNVTGYAYATIWSERSAYRSTVETTVYAAHNSTKSGVGSALYEALISQLTEKSIRNLIALPNEASIRLHERFGFVKSGEFKQVGYKFGRWIDVASWQLEIVT